MDARGVRCEAKLGELLLRSQQWGDADEEPPQWSSTANLLVAKVNGVRRRDLGTLRHATPVDGPAAQSSSDDFP
jgi:hypothetical protein